MRELCARGRLPLSFDLISRFLADARSREQPQRQQSNVFIMRRRDHAASRSRRILMLFHGKYMLFTSIAGRSARGLGSRSVARVKHLSFPAACVQHFLFLFSHSLTPRLPLHFAETTDWMRLHSRNLFCFPASAAPAALACGLHEIRYITLRRLPLSPCTLCSPAVVCATKGR